MNIPLDRLYYYIEDIACEIFGNNVIIYRFWPHGSKNVDNLVVLEPGNIKKVLSPEIYCNDQEPLNWKYYENSELSFHEKFISQNQMMSLQHKLFEQQGLIWEKNNFRHQNPTIWDKALVLHSEKNSQDVELYRKSDFIPVYYWTHAVLARDWFRYAEQISIKKHQITKTFLIYNRAWSGTREYRLKFMDLLIENNLISSCRTWFNQIDPDTKKYYRNHIFENSWYKPINVLEDFFESTLADSNCSADFDINDYNSTDFEIVLETLFSEDKIHLTEKILRPIALGQPFMLVSTPGSLKFLKDYGFKTFDSVIDENYDTVTDHTERLTCIVKVMKQIANWTDNQKADNLKKIKEITEYNKNYFFSKKFSNLILEELQNNLKNGLVELQADNTSKKYLDFRLRVHNNSDIKKILQSVRNEKDAFRIFKTAEYYYLRSLSCK